MARNFYVIFIVVICLASDTFARPILSIGVGLGSTTFGTQNGTANGTAAGTPSAFIGSNITIDQTDSATFTTAS